MIRLMVSDDDDDDDEEIGLISETLSMLMK